MQQGTVSLFRNLLHSSTTLKTSAVNSPVKSLILVNLRRLPKKGNQVMTSEMLIKQFGIVVDEIDKRDNGWRCLYKKMEAKDQGRYGQFTCEVGGLQQNLYLNRYWLFPWDHSRVFLKRGQSDYINANYVKVPGAGRGYILTQGPMETTVSNFWTMIWGENSSSIVMLCKLTEYNHENCCQYWPSGGSSKDMAGGLLVFPDVNLRVRHIEEKASVNFVIRKFRVEDINSEESREVIQFHYTAWPDYGVPSSPQDFTNFLNVVRSYGVFNANNAPVVHCSAGMGRSGSFCLIDSCLKMMEEGLQVNVEDVLLNMRTFRMDLVQTENQLRFCYIAIMEGLIQFVNGEGHSISNETDNHKANNVDILDEHAALQINEFN